VRRFIWNNNLFQFVSTAADLQPVICRIIRAHYEQGKDTYMSDLQLIVANVCTDQTVDAIAAFSSVQSQKYLSMTTIMESALAVCS
jgi:protein-disulfide isomerase-like protein with CxxC motif